MFPTYGSVAFKISRQKNVPPLKSARGHTCTHDSETFPALIGSHWLLSIYLSSLINNNFILILGSVRLDST